MQSVCFIGACPNMTRDELTAKASEKFEVRTGVTKDLDIIACANPGSESAAIKKARLNGTKIIGYDEFLGTLDSGDEIDFRQADSFAKIFDSFVTGRADPSEEYETRQVGFFTVKIRRKSAKQKKAEVVKYTHEQAGRILQKLRETTAAPSVRIRTRAEGRPLPAAASRFGGLPYWTRGEDFPTDANGKPLVLLAQINFAEVPRIPDFPIRGLLQVFVRADSILGCGYDGRQKNWRIVWRDVVSEHLAMGEGELREIGAKAAAEIGGNGGEHFPLKREFALEFERGANFVNPSCEDFGEAIRNAARELGLPVPEGRPTDWFDKNDLGGLFGGGAGNHRLGGHPDFARGDERRDGDVLLLQIGSETGEGREIRWGDCGVAHFFIGRDDLKSREFSNVLYAWDCR